MQLHERLMDLLGHEVSVAGRADTLVKEIAAATMKEFQKFCRKLIRWKSMS